MSNINNNEKALEFSGKSVLTQDVIFRQLLESPEFTEFALILKRLTGLSMALNTPNVNITTTGITGDTGNPLCKLIRDTPEGLRRCKDCERHQHSKAGDTGKPKLYTCHAGFYDMAIPILIHGKHLATISSGQVVPEKPSDAGFARLQQRLHWLEIPVPLLRKTYNKAYWMPRKDLALVMRLIEVFARQICDSGLRLHDLEARLERPQIRKAKLFVEKHFRDPQLQLDTVADHVMVSVAHFSHRFHRETGITFTRYVQSRRIAEAKRLLTETSKTITYICFACGFNSLTHFNRVFRKGEGCSPSQFRQK